MVASPLLDPSKKTILPPEPHTPLFGTDGIRGQAGRDLTPALALHVGFWAGRVLQQGTEGRHPFIVGQDSRNSSDMLAMALSAGLTAAGLDVWNLGLCPTPAVAYLTHTTDALGGVMVSASHNPPADNGIKFFGANGAKLSRTVQKEIESHLRINQIEQLSSKTTWGHHYHRPELIHHYTQAIQQPLTDNFKGLKVVLDLAWGAATGTAPDVFRAMQAEVICLHDQPDGDRINVGCGSTHLDLLQAAVAEHGADLGFAFDGDADRVLAVDAKGRVVDGDYILYLWGRQLQAQQQLPEDLIVATVMSNLGFERAWEARGGRLLRADVGDQYVHAEMVTTGAMLGGEQSGHILCPHYGIGGDGLLTALHLTTIVQQAGGCLMSLIDDSFQTYPQRLENVQVEDRDRRRHWEGCEPLQAAIERAKDDMGDQGRVLVRASGTEPVIRVMVEAATQPLTDQWTNYLVAIVKEHLGD
ncbi:MAG: phosphoglucosamine mutase [Thermosynechococcaceae cyanobacterium]